MESKAVIRYARITPRKARRVTDLIKGKKAGEAMIALKFMPYRGADLIGKLLGSAMANAGQKDAVSPEDMKISTAMVDSGPMMKRMMPRAQGRATIIKKKTSHITLVLSD